MIELPRLYVGCALSHAPEEFRDSVERLKLLLEEKYEVLKFLGLVAGTSTDVYMHDMASVQSADVFIAVCDYPSLGLGVEIERARQHRIPTLAVAHVDSQVTRLVLGMSEIEPTMHFVRYTDLVTDVPIMLAQQHTSIK